MEISGSFFWRNTFSQYYQSAQVISALMKNLGDSLGFEESIPYGCLDDGW